MFFFDFVKFPLGWIKISATNSFITRISFHDSIIDPNPNHITEICKKNLIAYLNKQTHTVRCPFILTSATPFQQLVWFATLQIPYGQTVSYKHLAEMIGRPNAFRAVAQALKKNPIPIIIPCHRIIYANGLLGGYNYKTNIKSFLINLEK